MKTILAAGVLAALVSTVASGAHAEKWVYYPVPGGAMAYDDDSRRIDTQSGQVAGDTLVYYHVPRAVGPDAYSFLIRRIVFDCRADKYQIRESAYFDPAGTALGQATAEEWLEIKANTTPSVFKRIMCDVDRPPMAKDAANADVLFAALKALPANAELTAATPAPARPAAQLAPAASVAPVPRPVAPPVAAPVVAAGPATPPPSVDDILTLAPRPAGQETSAAAPEVDPKTGKVKKNNSAGPLPPNPLLQRIPRDKRGSQ